jgi:3-phosphoshikimate 1-carboxyvinyltransferase
LDLHVPGDVSSAAFFLALAALGGAGEGLEIEGVGLNPTRTAYLGVLRRMGAPIETNGGAADGGGEPVGSVFGRPTSLRATEIRPEEVPELIDELPMLAVLGSRAEGVTRITGASELRHKESDRIAALAENLRTLGVQAEELADGIEVMGTDRPLEGRVQTRGDHRIAMAFGVLGALPGNRITIDDPDAADVSFPGFWELLSAASSGRRA